MKIDIQSIDSEQFNIEPKKIGDIDCFLVTPKRIGVKWTHANKIFRSSVWSADGDLISAGFYKFPNWGECPDTFPVPKDLSKTHIVEKLDGSCLIFSHYNGQYIIRTRGTVSAYGMENAHELDILKEKYPKLFDFTKHITTWIEDNPGRGRGISILCEWLSPSNQIVIKHDSPDIKLIGAVCHDEYTLYEQFELDYIAELLEIPRLGYFLYGSMGTLVDEINKFTNFEGVCIYSNRDQSIHKVKTELYLKKHRFKEHANIESVLDLFIESDCPKYVDFCEAIERQFDFECLEFVRGFVSQICDAYKEVLTIIDGFANFIETNRHLVRRDFAIKTISSYGETSRAAFVFTLLDKGKLDGDNVKKLMWQVLKK